MTSNNRAIANGDLGKGSKREGVLILSKYTCHSVLQIGRSRVWFQMMSLEFLIGIILPIALWPWVRLSL